MQKREVFKDIELSGRKWRIQKFTPLTGSYILYQLMYTMIPLGFDEMVLSAVGNQSGTDVGGLLGSMGMAVQRTMMTRQQFVDLQMDCLKVCKELRPLGNDEAALDILMPDGRWAVEEPDVMTVLMLMGHALIFNLTSFFEGNALSEGLKTLRDLAPSGAKMQTNSPTAL